MFLPAVVLDKDMGKREYNFHCTLPQGGALGLRARYDLAARRWVSLDPVFEIVGRIRRLSRVQYLRALEEGRKRPVQGQKPEVSSGKPKKTKG